MLRTIEWWEKKIDSDPLSTLKLCHVYAIWRAKFSYEAKPNSKKSQGKFEEQFLDDMHPILEEIALSYIKPKDVLDYHFKLGFVSAVYDIIHRRIYGT